MCLPSLENNSVHFHPLIVEELESWRIFLSRKQVYTFQWVNTFVRTSEVPSLEVHAMCIHLHRYVRYIDSSETASSHCYRRRRVQKLAWDRLRITARSALSVY